MTRTWADFPHAIREIENTFLVLSDGTRLAARIWLPVDAEAHPVPAILEYLPYRKDDCTAPGDALRHPYFAGHGYAAIRVDMRGSGDSDGLLLDEYLKQEQDDALEVLAWIAAQPWCDGNIGMYGISWGGFNGLQVAARRPPQLKAIISLCSTDDRYTDDCHYMGGCLLASDMLKWASMMYAYTAQPPDPKRVGARWRTMWLERMQHTPPFVEAWLSHQTRDAYWQHGSVIEDYSAITCPVFMVGGWADSYTNAIPRVLAGLSANVPRKGLIGPWSHMRPESGLPGPAIGFLQEALRWWDKWLKGIETGVMNEPMLRVWLQDPTPPRTHYDIVPGRWVAEPSWPSPNIESQTISLAELTSQDSSTQNRTCEVFSTQSNGANAGVWCPYGRPGDMPDDQRRDDNLSLCFETSPATEPMAVLGFPEVKLHVASDKSNAMLAARLCDVAPDGASLLVSWGLLNLTHRNGDETPEPLVPGQFYDVTMTLNACGHVLPFGHRWRLALSPTYWPHAWPSPEATTLRIGTLSSTLVLPVRGVGQLDEALPEFGPAETAEPLAREVQREANRQRHVQYDSAHQPACWTITDHFDDGREMYVRDGLVYDNDNRDVHVIIEGDPLSATNRCERTIRIERDAWCVRIETTSELTCDATTFFVTNELHAYEGDVLVYREVRPFSVPRMLV